jgi:hypothetical protein
MRESVRLTDPKCGGQTVGRQEAKGHFDLALLLRQVS